MTKTGLRHNLWGPLIGARTITAQPWGTQAVCAPQNVCVPEPSEITGPLMTSAWNIVPTRGSRSCSDEICSTATAQAATRKSVFTPGHEWVNKWDLKIQCAQISNQLQGSQGQEVQVLMGWFKTDAYINLILGNLYLLYVIQIYCWIIASLKLSFWRFQLMAGFHWYL